jgi:hypothetical protein
MPDARSFENWDSFLLNDDLVHAHPAAPDAATWREPLLHYRDLSSLGCEIERRRQSRWARAEDDNIALNAAQ